jgi:hypothetical protein
MRHNSFKPLSSPLYGLGEIKYFLLGLLADAVLLGCFFAYLLKLMPVDCRGTCTMYEYLIVGRYIIWTEVVYVIGLWPISIPVLAAPPGVGLWADLRKFVGWEGREWRAALWGAGCGMLGGLVLTCLYFLYEQLTRPNPYNVLTLFAAPVFVVIGGMAGLLAAAWYSSD